MATTIEIENKGIKFDSPYSDMEVAKQFRNLFEDDQLGGDFAISMYTAARNSGRYTPRQVVWLHVLVAQYEGRDIQPNVTTSVTGLQSVHEHLCNCRKARAAGGKGLLHPMVGLHVGDETVVLKLAGPKSKHYGKVSVASDHRYGHGQFYGWIDTSGNMSSRNPIPQAVVDILVRVSQDPIRVISEIGRESGRCCYCFAELTTVQSKIAGCGKRCADNYGVAYPNTAETREFISNNSGVLIGTSDAEKWELCFCGIKQ